MTLRNAFFAFSMIALSSSAEAAMVRISFSSGTGFFISRDGYALTNNHVVEKCTGPISVHGPKSIMDAKLVATDKEHDLALLKTIFTVSDIGYFNSMKQPLNAGDPVVVIGYPGQSWRSQEAVTRSAKIIDNKGPSGEDKWLQFSDSVQLGNSGGPLLDSSGNVVGVVVAKAELHILDASSGNETITKSDIAISLPTIREFLNASNVQYQEADSGIYLSPDRVGDRSKPFIVNIRCQVPEQH